MRAPPSPVSTQVLACYGRQSACKCTDFVADFPKRRAFARIPRKEVCKCTFFCRSATAGRLMAEIGKPGDSRTMGNRYRRAPPERPFAGGAGRGGARCGVALKRRERGFLKKESFGERAPHRRGGKASQGEAGASCAYPVGRTARGEVPSTFPRGLGEGAGRLVELRLCPRDRLGGTRTSLRDGGGDRCGGRGAVDSRIGRQDRGAGLPPG